MLVNPTEIVPLVLPRPALITTEPPVPAGEAPPVIFTAPPVEAELDAPPVTANAYPVLEFDAGAIVKALVG